MLRSKEAIEFNKIALDIAWISNNSVIPEDMFADHVVTYEIAIIDSRPDVSAPIELKIHRDAFRSSRNFTKRFKISNIGSYNHHMFNFSFLDDFNELQEFVVFRAYSFQWNTLPPLSNLNLISICRCHSVMNTLFVYNPKFPRLIKGLDKLELKSDKLQDKAAEIILEWVLTGPSYDTLYHVDLSGNELTRIPRQLKSFSRLKTIRLKNQKHPGFGVISSSSVPLPDSVIFLDLSCTHIINILPDTFEGIH